MERVPLVSVASVAYGLFRGVLLGPGGRAGGRVSSTSRRETRRPKRQLCPWWTLRTCHKTGSYRPWAGVDRPQGPGLPALGRRGQATRAWATGLGSAWTGHKGLGYRPWGGVDRPQGPGLPALRSLQDRDQQGFCDSLLLCASVGWNACSPIADDNRKIRRKTSGGAL